MPDEGGVGAASLTPPRPPGRLTPAMRSYDTAADSLPAIRAALTARDTEQDAQAEAVVRAILEDVKARGDAAVLDYTRRFDWPEATQDKLGVPQDELESAEGLLSCQDTKAPFVRSQKHR